MTEEQVKQKLDYLRDQKENPTGNYRKYLVRTYEYILNKSKENNTEWAKTNLREMIDYVYEESPDHMANELVVNYQKDLKNLGYIKKLKEDGEWHVYIIKELDF
ncbi:hypothetical protein BJV38_003286 [Clostridium beijerinckii]|uniref:hypothetical protein n=1 Tax=Clostridium beijerinckii TaxID=1520 RepID=UPI001F4C29F8|nr:hypothetical protein [Clostridium beijerinckii]NRT34128.1 hypothetical protein [Clostridium beijerinckii]NRT46443.1 hypothetical protein [Clostridium beijerinckii]NRZ19553.1 hypothetical protein [Clostridium beijerinckii]